MSAAAAGIAIPAPSSGSHRLRTGLQRLLLVLLFLVLWQAASSTVPGYLFPGPLDTWEAFLRIWKDGSIWLHLGVTMYRVTVGFAIAAAIGVPLGIVLGSSKTIGEFFSPIMPVMNSVSSAIWSLIAVVWFGLSDMTPIFVCLMTGLPLIVTNVWQGTRNVNAEWIELAHSVRMPRHKVFWKIYLPAVLPFFFSGARLAFGFGARVSLVAEALGASAGVGYMIVRSADLLQMSNVFAWSILLVLTIAAIDGLLIRPIESFLFRWRKES